MAFTASVKPDLLVEVSNIAASPNTVDAKYAIEPTSGLALIQRQTAQVRINRLQNGDCLDAKIWFYDAGNSTCYIGTTPDGTKDCDPPASSEGQTLSKDFAHNIFFNCHKQMDTRCDNELTPAMEYAKNIYDLMYRGRTEVSKFMLNQVVANAQANQVPTAPVDQMPTNFSNDATPGSNIVNIASAGMTGDQVFQTMVDLNYVASQNALYAPILLTGQNFRTTANLAQYNRVNDDQRSQGLFFDPAGVGGNMVWDTHPTHGVDAVTSALSTLAVNPNAYAFWNWTEFDSIPRVIDASKNHYAFSMPDPVWTYNLNGTQVPVMWDVEIWETCTGRNAKTGKLEFRETMFVQLRGGFEFLPAGFDLTGANQIFKGAMHFTTV